MESTTSDEGNFTELTNDTDYSFDYSWYDPTGYEPSDAIKITLGFFYGSIFLVSVVSNCLVIAVLGFVSRTRSDLTVFLINLAVGDLLMALSFLPIRYVQICLRRWIFGPVVCSIFSGMQVWFIALSSFTNVAIGIDRYWAILHPLKPRLSKKGAKVAIACIWVLATGFAMPGAIVSKIDSRFGGKLKNCYPDWPSATFMDVYMMSYQVCTYFGPVAILSFVYGRICLRLYDRRPPGNADEARDRMQLKSKKKIIKMLIAVVVGFTVCWLPLQVYSIIRYFAPHLLYETMENHAWMVNLKYWFKIVNILISMTSCFINPIIFGFQNDNFRADLKKLLTCRWKAFANVTTQRYFSVATRSTKSSTSSTRSRDRALSRGDLPEKPIFKANTVQTLQGTKTVMTPDEKTLERKISDV